MVEELRQIGCDLYLDREAVDTTTPAGRALLGMASVFAAFERDMVVERTKAGLARARLRGTHIGRPPTGDGTCEAIRSLRAQGLGINKLARELRVGKPVVQRVANEMRGRPMAQAPEIPARRVVNAAGKSEWRIGRRGLKVVEELAERGVAVATIAKALRMGKDAFMGCRQRQPEVQEALDRGRAK